MSHAHYDDEEDHIVNGVDHAVVSDPDAVEVLGALEFLTGRRTRIISESQDSDIYPPPHVHREGGEILSRGCLDLDAVGHLVEPQILPCVLVGDGLWSSRHTMKMSSTG